MTTHSGRPTDQLIRDAGTVLHAGFPGTAAPDWLRRRLAAGEVGGCILFKRNIEDPEQVAALTAALREANPDTIVAIDEEGGDVTRIEVDRGSSYPGNLALGVVDDPATTEDVARAIARDLRAMGVTLDYAPDADVNANPDNPVIGVRSFGADSQLVARHTAAYVRGMQGEGIAACAKHFPGHGDSSEDSHLGLPLIDLDEVGTQLHLAPFRAAIEAGAKAVMTAHVLYPRYGGSLPATMSHEVLTGLLRGELGFDGLIVTDGIDMGPISGTYGVAEGTVKAIAAGADAICWGGSPAGEEEFLYLRTALAWAVREGRLSEQRLHEAAERNRAVGRWAAEQRAALPELEPAAAAGFEVGLGAARRALRVHGELKPLTSAAHVAEFVPVLSFAIAPGTAWGVAEPLAQLLPGTTAERIDAPTARTESVGLMESRVIDPDAAADTASVLTRAVGRPLVVAVRDLGRNAWMEAAVRTLLADRPDAVVVEMGLPHRLIGQLAGEGFTVLCTHGASRVCGLAAAEALMGRASG
ncbi:MAG TPA: glycoside hydrolase family 3 protein [Actinocrinis sp.]|jgi:beta-N-acetylhexosaminidase